MASAFDQFDALPASANAFDQFDKHPAPTAPESTWAETLRHPIDQFKAQVLDNPAQFARDLGTGAISLGRGAVDAAIGIPGMAADAVWQLKNRLTGTSDQASPLPTQIVNAGLDQATGGPPTAGNAALRAVSSTLLGSRIPLPGQPAPAAAKVPTPAEQAAADAQSLNSDRDAVLAAARQRGYVVPPTAINPTLGNTAVESVAGKAATRQGAAAINQQLTDAGTRLDLALPPTKPLTRDGIQSMITKVGNATYGAIKKVGGTFSSDGQYQADLQGILQSGQDLEAAYPGIGAQAGEQVQSLVKSLDVPTHDPEKAVELFKYLRNQAKDNFNSAFAGESTNTEALALARAQSAAADAVKDLIKRNLIANGRQDLADSWDAGATQIAKGYQALGALKGNHINALSLAAQFRRDKPLSGAMALAAKFADQFPEVAAIPKSGTGVSKLEATAGVASAGTALATGHPLLAASALAGTAVPFALRRWMLSGGGQNFLATPSYGAGLAGLGGPSPPALLGGSAPLLVQGLGSP